jgi:hypothetical protein
MYSYIHKKLQNLSKMDSLFKKFIEIIPIYYNFSKKITDLLEREERERRLKEEEEAKNVVKSSPLKKKKLFK